ncbi:MAG: hypothetical protein OQK24_15125 [Magnetovibrio sp.]|nr:hypothetical protein [Magnetovibrio sp.]
MITPNTIQLLEMAAANIKATAQELKMAHTTNGVWEVTDRIDVNAMISYLHDIRLARQLKTEADRLKEAIHVV